MFLAHQAADRKGYTPHSGSHRGRGAKKAKPAKTGRKQVRPDNALFDLIFVYLLLLCLRSAFMALKELYYLCQYHGPMQRF